MSKEVKIAIITTIGALLAAIISGVFVLMKPPDPPHFTPNNHYTTRNGMTNNGNIYVVFNQNLPPPTVTPDNTPISTGEAAQNPYAQDMQTLQFNASLQDNTNPDVQWEESNIALNTGQSICGFQDQSYHAYDEDSNNASYTTCLAQQPNGTDFTYEVQMLVVQGYSGGVFFRSQNSQSSQFAYLFLIRSDGLYGLYVVLSTPSGPYFKGLVGGTISSFNQGLDQTNTIAIVARGSQIDIYVNQLGIARVIDDTYSQGGVGVAAWSNSDIVFRNAKLWTA